MHENKIIDISLEETEEKTNIEDMIINLENIVKKMGESGISLDESLNLYTSGIKLAQNCFDKINDAKQIIEQHKIVD